MTRSLDPKKQKKWGIWLSVDGNNKTIYESDSAVCPVGWSQTGRELILRSLGGSGMAPSLPADVGIIQLDPTTMETKELSRAKAAYFQNFSLSPDRKILAFVSRAAGNDALQIVPLAGGTPKTLVTSNDSRVYFSSLTFAPDGAMLYYGKQSNWQVISMIENFK